MVHTISHTESIVKRVDTLLTRTALFKMSRVIIFIRLHYGTVLMYQFENRVVSWWCVETTQKMMAIWREMQLANRSARYVAKCANEPSQAPPFVVCKHTHLVVCCSSRELS